MKEQRTAESFRSLYGRLGLDGTARLKPSIALHFTEASVQVQTDCTEERVFCFLPYNRLYCSYMQVCGDKRLSNNDPLVSR